MKRVVFSGIQPTGSLHIGNYLGAIKQYDDLQNSHDCFLSIVDLHAMTVLHNLSSLLENTKRTAALYLSAGVDPERVTIFVQSQVPQHAELAWILFCFTNMGQLNRMVQFKQKSGQNQQNTCLGLYAYPCLMAADILLYQTDLVPVGDDQRQHLELTIDIIQRINHLYGETLFQEPKPLIMDHLSRIMSLRNVTQKMSKTDRSDHSRINLDDSNDAIALKIKKAVTDDHPFPTSVENLKGRPAILNLSNIYVGMGPITGKSSLVKRFAGKPLSLFKRELTDVVVAKIEPMRTRYEELLRSEDYIEKVLREGQSKAVRIAEKTLKKIKNKMNLFT